MCPIRPRSRKCHENRLLDHVPIAAATRPGVADALTRPRSPAQATATIYISAFEALLLIETTFGTQLREHAIRISKERYALRQEAMRSEFESASAVQHRADQANGTIEKEPRQPREVEGDEG